METFLTRLKEIERVIEKFLDGLENTEEELWNEDEIVNIQKYLDEFKENLEKMKGFCETKHEEVYYKQYLNSFFKMKRRFVSFRNASEVKRLQKELIGNGNSNNSTQIDILLSESRNLDNSLEAGRTIMAAAEDVKNSLSYQKDKVEKTSDKIVKFVETLPGISSLIGKISRRKRMNAIVIGIAFFICMIITIVYLF